VEIICWRRRRRRRRRKRRRKKRRRGRRRRRRKRRHAVTASQNQHSFIPRSCGVHPSDTITSSNLHLHQHTLCHWSVTPFYIPSPTHPPSLICHTFSHTFTNTPSVTDLSHLFTHLHQHTLCHWSVTPSHTPLKNCSIAHKRRTLGRIFCEI